MSEHKKKATVLDMSKYLDKSVRVKFMGGREVVGILKGYDALLNLVMDESQEVALRREPSTAWDPMPRSPAPPLPRLPRTNLS